MKWRIFSLNIDKPWKLRMPEFSLFHSEIVKGKKEFFKKLCFTLKMGMLCTFLGAWDEWIIGIKWKKKLKLLVFKNFIKAIKFSVPTSKSKGVLHLILDIIP